MLKLNNPLDEASNTLIELKALVRMALFHAEATEPEEFADLKNELVAIYYMMLDKTNAAIGTTERMYRDDIRDTRIKAMREAHH